jgi:hypothetical protein
MKFVLVLLLECCGRDTGVMEFAVLGDRSEGGINPAGLVGLTMYQSAGPFEAGPRRDRS